MATDEVLVTPAPPTSTTARPHDSVPPSTTTTIPRLEVRLQLNPVEQLASRRGVTIAVAIDGEVVGHLSADDSELAIEAAEGDVVEFRYLTPQGTGTDVGWVQSIVGSPMTVVQPWRSGGATDPEILVAWQTGDPSRHLDQLDAAPSVTVTSPISWFVSDEGNILGGPDAGLIAAAHERGLGVWPAVQSLDADAIHLLLVDPAGRSAAAARISAEAEAAGADGVNIDLEGFRNEDASALTSFVTELAELVHGWGGVVTYDLVPRTDQWDVAPAELSFWSSAPQRRSIAAVVDYTVLMAYDQHNRFRPAGPVAAPQWVEDSVVYMLRYADPDSVILGIPAYGRLWDSEALDEPRAISLGFFDGRSGTRMFDPQFQMDRIDLADGTFFWADNEVTPQRIAIAHRYGLAGWAVWRLGLDHAGLWEAFAAGG